MNAEAVASRLLTFEGSEPFMYLDTDGCVTVGVGHMIPSATAATALTWANGTQASIATDWARVKGAPPLLVAAAYQRYSSCRMLPGDIQALLEADIQSFTKQITAALPNFPTYPEPVQEALFDIAYNTGVAGLLNFHHMLASVATGDWATAAAQCHRAPPISEARNRMTAELFLMAAHPSAPATT